MERLEPITTFEVVDADYSTADRLAETARYFQRQTAIARCLDGQEAPDVVLDMLEAHGLDPVAYVEAVEANVDLVLVQSLPVQLWL